LEIVQNGEDPQEGDQEMTEELPNPSEEGYRTAHKQNKDGGYADVVMPADIFTEKDILLEEKVPKGSEFRVYMKGRGING